MFVVVRMPGGVYPVARSPRKLAQFLAAGGRVYYRGLPSGWSERFR